MKLGRRPARRARFCCVPVSVISLVVAGCTSMPSLVPVGSEPVLLEPEEWNGVWVEAGGGEAFDVSVDERSPGRVVVSRFTKRYTDGITGAPVYVRKHGAWNFLSIEMTGPEHYEWGRMFRFRDELLFWYARKGEFERLIKEGVLPAIELQADDGTSELVLDQLSGSQLDSIIGTGYPGAFGPPKRLFRIATETPDGH